METISRTWERNLSFLIDFKKEFGHVRVLTNLQFKNFHLGRWVSKQRAKVNNLSDEKKNRLNALGFIWDASEMRDKVELNNKQK